jgi:hypothetical protein
VTKMYRSLGTKCALPGGNRSIFDKSLRFLGRGCQRYSPEQVTRRVLRLEAPPFTRGG